MDQLEQKKQEYFALDKLFKAHKKALADFLIEKEKNKQKVVAELTLLTAKKENKELEYNTLVDAVDEVLLQVDYGKKQLKELGDQKAVQEKIKLQNKALIEKQREKSKEVSAILKSIGQIQQNLIVYTENLATKRKEYETLILIVKEEKVYLEEVKKANVLEAEKHKISLLAEVKSRLAILTEQEGDLSKRESIYQEKIGKLRSLKLELESYYNRTFPNFII